MDDITLISVTYGKRWNLLRTVLEAGKAQGITRAIVVDNGSAEDLATIVPSVFGDWVQLVQTGGNLGSAAGFKYGMEAALAGAGEYVLILDDDNILTPGALEKLLAVLKIQRDTNAMSAVCGSREDHGGMAAVQAAMGFKPHFLNSFLNFHLLDIPGKIAFRKNKAAVEQDAIPKVLQIPNAPYGGLLFHRDLLAQIGLPNTDFVLYGDDTEFTYRITAKGGFIGLVPDAVIEDAEASWYAGDAKEKGTSFDAWLTMGSDMRIYYAMRNRVFWELRGRRPVGLAYYVNVVSYLTLLTTYAVAKRKTRRLPLVFKALNHAFAGKLGTNKDYRLI